MIGLEIYFINMIGNWLMLQRFMIIEILIFRLEPNGHIYAKNVKVVKSLKIINGKKENEYIFYQ